MFLDDFFVTIELPQSLVSFLTRASIKKYSDRISNKMSIFDSHLTSVLSKLDLLIFDILNIPIFRLIIIPQISIRKHNTYIPPNNIFSKKFIEISEKNRIA